MFEKCHPLYGEDLAGWRHVAVYTVRTRVEAGPVDYLLLADDRTKPLFLSREDAVKAGTRFPSEVDPAIVQEWWALYSPDEGIAYRFARPADRGWQNGEHAPAGLQWQGELCGFYERVLSTEAVDALEDTDLVWTEEPTLNRLAKQRPAWIPAS